MKHEAECAGVGNGNLIFVKHEAECAGVGNGNLIFVKHEAECAGCRGWKWESDICET